MRYTLAFAIYIVFLVLVPLVSEGTFFKSYSESVTAFNQTELYVLHFPSLFYIGLIFTVFYIVGKVTQEGLGIAAFKEHIENSKKQIENISALMKKEPEQAYALIHDEMGKQSLFSRLLNVVTNGKDEDIHIKFNIEQAAHLKHLREQIKFLSGLGSLLPLLGMVGTITGLMFIFSATAPTGAGAEDAFANKFTAMGTALLTTLYATLITALWIKPRQAKKQKLLSEYIYDIELLKNNLLLFKHSIDLNQLHHKALLERAAITTLNQQLKEKQETTKPVEEVA